MPQSTAPHIFSFDLDTHTTGAGGVCVNRHPRRTPPGLVRSGVDIIRITNTNPASAGAAGDITVIVDSDANTIFDPVPAGPVLLHQGDVLDLHVKPFIPAVQQTGFTTMPPTCGSSDQGDIVINC